MTDIVERLRHFGPDWTAKETGVTIPYAVCVDAADEIERLRACVDGPDQSTHGHQKDYKWWCKSCGTLTNDGECDCTTLPETENLQVLIRNP